MSERLRDMVKLYGMKTGRNWKAKLCARADISVSTLNNLIGKRRPIQPGQAYRIALACDRNEQEALEVEKECAPVEAKAG